MAALRSFILGLDRLLGRLEAAALAAMVLAITAVTFAQVFTRYVTETPLIWTEEVARYLFVWITLVGAAAAVRSNGHFGLDLLRRHFPLLRKPLGAATMLAVGAFFALLLWTGIAETRQAALQMSPALQVGMQWAYLALPVGAALGLFHVIAHWARSGIAAHPLDGHVDEGSM
ncbi:MAG TPA: TRAP transporter small permease [Steroidobacteraceae bacterium]